MIDLSQRHRGASARSGSVYRAAARIRGTLIVPYRTIALCTLATSVVLASVALQPWVPAAELLRDPVATANQLFAQTNGADACCGVHLGLVSHLGVACWVVSAAIAGFAAACIRTDRTNDDRTGTERAMHFLLVAAVLSAWLGIDDLLLLHERVLPALGVPELATYAAYGAAGLLHLALAWRVAPPALLVLLLLAIGFLGLSVLADSALELVGIAVSVGREDGAKLMGIVFWLAFHVRLAAALMAVPTARDTGAGA